MDPAGGQVFFCVFEMFQWVVSGRPSGEERRGKERVKTGWRAFLMATSGGGLGAAVGGMERGAGEGGEEVGLKRRGRRGHGF